jgi:hypothetical protein
MLGLYNIDLPTLTGDAVNVWCLHAKVILDGLKETGNLPRQVVCSFVMS